MPPPQLPTELWLLILSHCPTTSNSDLWLSLRSVSTQLRSCVEQYFAVEVMRKLSVSLPMTMPSYDARNPIRGEATFTYCAGNDSVLFGLNEGKTGPEFYLSHFMGRWAGMRDVDGGWLRESVLWILRLDGVECRTRVKGARAVRLVEDGDGEEKEARMRFDWKPTLTTFYKKT